MSDLKMEDLVEKKEVTPASEEKVETKVEETKVETEQDPLKTELERVQKSKYSDEEKAEFTFKKQAERLKALGKDPASILGIEKDEDEDDTLLTVGMLKKMQQETASKTALQQADEIQNET